ncbi:hypothetical protein ACP70R_043163 [Stipagrostis hirtigluma subsp. patula]
MDEDRSWMYSERQGRLYSQVWAEGVEKFVEHAFSLPDALADETSRCPCSICGCSHKRKREEVTMHLLRNGFQRGYQRWRHHGEAPGQPETVEEVEDVGEVDRMDDMLLDSIAAEGVFPGEEPTPAAAEFYKLLEKYDTPVHEKTTQTTLSIVGRLTTIKSQYNMSEACYNEVTSLIHDIVGDEVAKHIPRNFYLAKKLVQSLGMPYKKIDVCKNNCMLFYKENEDKDKCPFCGEPRYEESTIANQSRRIPRKVLRYLPITPRLHRRYMSEKTSKYMTWHANHERTNLMVHPSDGEAWKENLNVFMQPLIDELLHLFEHGVITYDSHLKQNFNMRAALIWTIHDFLAYGMVACWSTHGKLACPYCGGQTKSFDLKHGHKPCWFDCHRRFLPRNHPFRRSMNNATGVVLVINLDEADKILDINLQNLTRQMMSDLKKEATDKVYQKESVEEEEDEEGNLWPKAEELMSAKPIDFATRAAWDALCQYWSTPSFRKKSLRGKKNRLAGGDIVYHCSGSRGLAATRQFMKIRDGVDPGQIGAWHHQHRMQNGTNRALCSKKAATTWARYDNAMTEKCGENWQVDHPDIDHTVVHDISGLPRGSFAMGDGVISPSDADSIKSRKRVHQESQASGASCSRTMLRQMESNPEWRAGIERVLQAISDKINLDFNDLMQEEAESNLDWCSGVERVLQAMAKIIPVDINALLQPRHPFQSTSASGSGASRQTSDGTREVRSDARIDHGIDDDQMSA